MDKKVFDDLSIRFLISLSKEDCGRPERLYFVLEEAHWYYIDFIQKNSKINLKTFSQALLQYNNLKFSEKEFRDFQKYKKSVPVYGALIINQHFNKILLVRGYNQQCFFFPKGKKNRDETPQECAAREVYEEIGYDIENKILSTEIQIGKKFIVFPVINVSDSTHFETRTRNEIETIRWVGVDEIIKGNDPSLYNINESFPCFKDLLDDFRKNRFRFKLEKFEKIFN